MPNSFFPEERYPFMYKNKEIGTFIVDCDIDGDYQYAFTPKKNIDESLIPWDFKDVQGKFISLERDKRWHNEIIKLWVESRVFPPERQNSWYLLKEVRISEYDQLSVLKHTEGRDRLDPYWIQFNKEEG